jgi:hypothetical protein
MDIPQFTTICERIFTKASAKIPLGLRAGLTHDPWATRDSERVMQTLKFCIWKDAKSGFWNRHYSSYHIIYDPQKELSEDCLFQVRFMFFLDRKEVGKDKFHNDVFTTLRPLDQQHGFECVITSKLAMLTKRYPGIGVTQQWETDATEALAWLLTSTLPKFSKL